MNRIARPVSTPPSTSARTSATSSAAPISSAAKGSPEQVARSFYDAFTKGDFATMESLYAPNVKFKDLVFEYGDRKGTMGMWRRIVAPRPGNVFKAQFERVEGNVAIVKWTADYNFLGHPVHNELESHLTIENGKIVKHEDVGDWHRWAHQAFPGMDGFTDGPVGRSVVQHVLRGVLPFLPK